MIVVNYIYMIKKRSQREDLTVLLPAKVTTVSYLNSIHSLLHTIKEQEKKRDEYRPRTHCAQTGVYIDKLYTCNPAFYYRSIYVTYLNKSGRNPAEYSNVITVFLFFLFIHDSLFNRIKFLILLINTIRLFKKMLSLFSLKTLI
ncbi:hypothetical protein EDEG_00319 [Edhazardia aedis USNM 41457]|uniref:Uncharacterized protein n=1 Tax=Edhazardia aedis (strain USNM 41457) TaxID=1003232 RepID=J8ZQI8_EDHAE|nr:hypothetical protein EDEG_00319 [Edhazardia aedis USNM 41457]|eukprot:EJW01973.1 hypothetical protein EDEG_00319 [Edhazardia aedis USNM 41457]